MSVELGGPGLSGMRFAPPHPPFNKMEQKKEQRNYENF